ncbi:MAG: hypothetical protein AAF666_02795 [Pseudomonadota bacterium]
MNAQNLSLHTPTDFTGCARLFVQMYEALGYDVSLETAPARLGGMLDAGFQLTELRDGGDVIGFALWIDLADYVFIRSFAIDSDRRTAGLGSVFFERLKAEVMPSRPEYRIEVVDTGPHGFWSSLGFEAKTTGMWLTERHAA